MPDQKQDQRASSADNEPYDPPPNPAKLTDPQEESGWQRGVWYASTTGRFMPMLLDRGPADNTIVWREVDVIPGEETDEFISRMEIFIVPDSLVRTVLVQLKEAGQLGGVDKVLSKFLKAGIL